MTNTVFFTIKWQRLHFSPFTMLIFYTIPKFQLTDLVSIQIFSFHITAAGKDHQMIVSTKCGRTFMESSIQSTFGMHVLDRFETIILFWIFLGFIQIIKPFFVPIVFIIYYPASMSAGYKYNFVP